MEKHRVVLKIAGKEYTIVSTDTQEHVRRVGAYVDLRLKETELATRLPSHAASVLTCMNIADELLKAQDENTRLRRELMALRAEEGPLSDASAAAPLKEDA